jgi:hypothetical protein
MRIFNRSGDGDKKWLLLVKGPTSWRLSPIVSSFEEVGPFPG